LRINKIIPVLAAILLLQACVTDNPALEKSDKASKINVQLGIGYLQQNNLDLANEKLSKALRQNPDSAAAHNAYAILQDRLLQLDKAEYHYKKATELDPKDSQAANNYGAFLCRNGRERESEEYFLSALENPLYKTPQFAYTNAAICLLKIGNNEQAKEYLLKAIAAKNNFGPALLAMADVLYGEGDHIEAKKYLDHFHLVVKPNPESLWLAIRNTLYINDKGDISELVARFEADYPESRQYKDWLKSDLYKEWSASQ
jgi:type IV pilus assembly protein PilF